MGQALFSLNKATIIGQNMKELLKSTAEWQWKTRIYVSIALISLSIVVEVYTSKIWIWGYFGAVFLIVTAFFFKEKHIEYRPKKAEELVVTDFNLTFENLSKLFGLILLSAEKGFTLEKSQNILNQVKDFPPQTERMFNCYIKTSETGTSLTIQISKFDDFFVVRFTSNQQFSNHLKRLAI